MNRLLLALCVFFLCANGFSATGVGNGGDVIGTYLDETRYKLIETIGAFVADAQANKDHLCDKQIRLAALQKRDCAFFVARIAQGVLDLNIHENRTPFVLSMEDVMVVDEEGGPKRVAAKTLAGPEGEITFDYEMISSRNPMLMFALLFHEFGHKARFDHQVGDETREFVTDYGPVLSFAKGNELLDAASLSLADWAAEKNLIGNGFSIQDLFQCQSVIRVGDQNVSGGSFRSYDIRKFTGNAPPPERFHKYSMGIGPGHQMQFGLPGDNNTELVYRLEIEESANCEENVPNGSGKSIVALFNVVKDPKTGNVLSTTLLDQKMFDTNPACADDPKTLTPFSVTHGDVTLSCQYVGSFANTTTVVSAMKKGLP